MMLLQTMRSARQGSGKVKQASSLHQRLLSKLHDDRAFGYVGRACVDARCIIFDPVACNSQALVSAFLVGTNGDGHATIARSEQSVADDARHFLQGGLDVGLVIFQDVEKLACPSSQIGSCDHRFKGSPVNMRVRNT
jgi:hypothetical protein